MPAPGHCVWPGPRVGNSGATWRAHQECHPDRRRHQPWQLGRGPTQLTWAPHWHKHSYRGPHRSFPLWLQDPTFPPLVLQECGKLYRSESLCDDVLATCAKPIKGSPLASTRLAMVQGVGHHLAWASPSPLTQFRVWLSRFSSLEGALNELQI